MAEKRPNKEFGKRRPQPLALPPKEPVKRSGHVALLVMGTIAVGTTAYTLMPRQNCDPPAQTQPNTACTSRGSSGGGGGGHWSSRSSFSSSDSSSHSSSGGSSSSGGVTRGGFGSFAHAFGFSGGG
ncbi:hypothetical protein NLM33_38845 [Bradyrhizobium sp. CCGUVB1N3]|uniref:hypothetical protein n=1 Tax=Bradyrhizobium sp. CCGUVB1N3 TaxID=2949629 RepID=UPI0020B2C1BF|nr:hypothetical protein [Bradyrhizobium sp. CCGUVB1N3]MCP3476178.1 hypothetical protein [Bradyrhizobium sp. CCGUVB1N3]